MATSAGCVHRPRSPGLKAHEARRRFALRLFAAATAGGVTKARVAVGVLKSIAHLPALLVGTFERQKTLEESASSNKLSEAIVEALLRLPEHKETFIWSPPSV